MERTINPYKISIYVNTSRRTMSQIKSDLKCTHIINAGLYTRSTYTPCGHLKSNGVIYSNEPWSRQGLGFNNGEKVLHWSNDMSLWDNYIDCVELIKDGQMVPIGCTDEMKYACNRTAIGYKAGKLSVYCSVDDDTPASLQAKLFDEGWTDVLMLDGGGSTQGIFDDVVAVSSSRVVYSYICIWEVTRVQVGAFKTRLGADSLCNEIKHLPDPLEAGYANAKVYLINGWYKVQVGAFFARLGAVATKNDLLTQGYPAFTTTN